MDCFVASLLAMTANPDTTTRSRGAMRPSCAFIFRPLEGVGNAGCPLHPRPRVHFVLVERTRVTTSTPESPGIPARNGFNGLCRALPGDRALLPPSSRGYLACPHPVGPTCLPQNLTPASGRQDHTILPSAATSLVRPLFDRSRIQRTRPAIPSRAKRCRVHRIRPYVRDDRDTPLLWGGMRNVLEVIWGVRKQEYFCKEDWTAQIRLIQFNKFACARKSAHGSERKFRSCPGRGVLHAAPQSRDP